MYYHYLDREEWTYVHGRPYAVSLSHVHILPLIQHSGSSVIWIGTTEMTSLLEWWLFYRIVEMWYFYQ